MLMRQTQLAGLPGMWCTRSSQLMQRESIRGWTLKYDSVLKKLRLVHHARRTKRIQLVGMQMTSAEPNKLGNPIY